jgi:hypothetical protein
MIKMKTLIYLFTIFFNFQYFANSQSLEIEYKISKPPLCTNNNGKNVYFKNLNSKTGMFPAGVAKKDINGLPVIYRFNYQKAPKSLQIFIDFHECAHHQTGDLEKKPPQQNSFEYMMKESIADCVAAIRIKSDTINGKILMKEVLVELKKDMTTIGFPKSTIESRKLNIVKCFKKDISLSTYIDNVLHKRNLK